MTGLEQLPKEIDSFAQHVRQAGAGLVVLDPLMAFLPPSEVDSCKDQSIRVVLARLQGMAEQTRAAIALVVHLNKGRVKTAIRFGGSQARSACRRQRGASCCLAAIPPIPTANEVTSGSWRT